LLVAASLSASVGKLFGWFAGSFLLRLLRGARSQVTFVVLTGFGCNSRRLHVHHA
jgi:hypothetical protein